jgi:rod shape determining protein RodA
VIFEPSLCADGVRWSVLRDYQQQRICTLLDPAKRDPLGKGFPHHPGHDRDRLRGRLGQGLHAGYADASGVHSRAHHRLHLRGLLRGVRPDRQPAADIGVYTFLVLRALTIALDAPTLFSRLLAGALAMMFFSYAFVNMGMVSGILPVVGVPLPFISYGGTAMVTLGLALGILMSISKSQAG